MNSRHVSKVRYVALSPMIAAAVLVAAPAAAGEAAAALFRVPLDGAYKTTSYFGLRRDPISNRQSLHHGVDFATRAGTGVVAARAGVVTFAGEKSGYGLTVEIDHGRGLSSRYAHLGAVYNFVGARVSVGDLVGVAGETGRTTGPRLHFEISCNGKPTPAEALIPDLLTAMPADQAAKQIRAFGEAAADIAPCLGKRAFRDGGVS